MAKARSERRLEDRLASLAKPKLLIVVELGYLPLEPDAAHLFFQLVNRRYEKGAMLITSNRNIAEWGTVFGDAIVATAILDRPLHNSHVITIRGDSYRLPATPQWSSAEDHCGRARQGRFRMTIKGAVFGGARGPFGWRLTQPVGFGSGQFRASHQGALKLAHAARIASVSYRKPRPVRTLDGQVQ